MAKVLILYHSTYGHNETMANAIADGARAAGATVDVKRVPETVPREVAQKSGYKLDQPAPVAAVSDLPDYDAIIVGCGTRYGRMASQMAAFWDQAGALWASGALTGKIGATFTSTGSQHGGQETTQFSLITNLLHMGLTIVGLDYGYQAQLATDSVHGCSPYGASTVAGKGELQPTEIDLGGARYLGDKVARLAAKVFG